MTVDNPRICDCSPISVCPSRTPGPSADREKRVTAESTRELRRAVEDVALSRVEAVREEVRQALREYVRVSEEHTKRVLARFVMFEVVEGSAGKSLETVTLNPKDVTCADLYNASQAMRRWIAARPDMDLECPPDNLARSYTWLPRKLRSPELPAWAITGINPGQPV